VIRALDLGDAGTVAAIVALQRASYAVEAELLGTNDIPALRETEEQLAASGETFLGEFDAERLVGAISYRATPDLLDIHRLVVHPDAFRRGIASRLLAVLPAAPRYVVATGAANAPARRLYERHGFAVAREREIAPGLVILELEK